MVINMKYYLTKFGKIIGWTSDLFIAISWRSLGNGNDYQIKEV